MRVSWHDAAQSNHANVLKAIDADSTAWTVVSLYGILKPLVEASPSLRKKADTYENGPNKNVA
jgi:hypothetical protein